MWKYELNEDYIQYESRKRHSELVQFLLDYDDPLPIALYSVFDPYNKMGFHFNICKYINLKHEDNWIKHQKYNAFAKNGESFEECDQRLIRELLSQTDLPIFNIKR